jgi:hypothetical protein
MKQELDIKTAGIAIAVVVAALGIGAVLYFRGSFESTPTVTPKPWSPPGAWAGAPGQGGQAEAAARFGGKTDKPMGAPDSSGSK